MGRKKPTILRATPTRPTTARMREDDKDDCIGNPFLLLFQGQDCLNRTLKMFSVEYKLGVSQGGSVICPISSLRTIAVACFGIDDLFSFAFSSYSIMDVSLPRCTRA